MLRILKQIWQDPVWSKVIAGIILAIIAAIWAGRHFDWWPRLLANYPTPLWFTVLIVAFGILAAAVVAWKQLQLNLARAQTPSFDLEPNIKTIDVTIPPVNTEKILTFPLKCYVQLRNDSSACADVRLSEYKPNTVPLKEFVVDVLQVKLRSYLPSDHGVDRVAVLPGQFFRAWVAIDSAKFSADQLNQLRGRIGTLVLLVNGQQVNVAL